MLVQWSGIVQSDSPGVRKLNLDPIGTSMDALVGDEGCGPLVFLGLAASSFSRLFHHLLAGVEFFLRHAKHLMRQSLGRVYWDARAKRVFTHND